MIEPRHRATDLHRDRSSGTGCSAVQSLATELTSRTAEEGRYAWLRTATLGQSSQLRVARVRPRPREVVHASALVLVANVGCSRNDHASLRTMHRGRDRTVRSSCSTKTMMGTAVTGGSDRANKAADMAVACLLMEGIGLSGARVAHKSHRRCRWCSSPCTACARARITSPC